MRARAAIDLRIVPADDELLRRWQTPSSIWLTTDARGCDIASVIEAFGIFLTYCDGAARLLVLRSGESGIRRPAIEPLVAALELTAQVEFVDATNPSARKAALLAADAFVVAGGTPETCFEAMAMGTPVIGSTPEPTIPSRVAELWWQGAEPIAALFAASMERVRADAPLRTLLRARASAELERIAAGARMRSGEPAS
jgi:glycosyltransferase involved in cell wall biosynthesis